MSLRNASLLVLLICLALQFLAGDRHKAADQLPEFYNEISTARFDDARRTMDEAIRLWPENARFYGWRGYARSQRFPSDCGRCGGERTARPDPEELKEVISDYRKAIQLNALDAVSHHNLGWLSHLAGDDDMARQNFQKAVELDPTNAVFHASFGMWLEERGESAAHDQYLKAIEISPAMVDSPFFRALRSRAQQDSRGLLEEAISQDERELQKGSNPILRARLGKLYWSVGRGDEGKRQIEQSLHDLPTLSRAWLNLGEMENSNGQRDLAFADYRRANLLDARLSDADLRLAQAYQLRSETAEAIHYFQLTAAHWERMTPVTAAHNRRLYGGPAQTIDDLLPTTLVWYTSPCTASEAFAGLAELQPARAQYRRQLHICEQLPAPHGCWKAFGQ